MGPVSATMTCLSLTLLVICVNGYDEAGCNARSNKTYYSGINRICRLPNGAHSDDENELIPFQMNRCNNVESKESGVLDIVYGLLASFLACIMIGSMYIPVKKFKTGDGVFYQWTMATGIFLVGLIFDLAVRSQPSFFYISMTGGILSSSANLLTVPFLKLVGMGVGQTMLGLANLVGGWISGRFILCQPLKYPIMNAVGVAVAMLSAILLSFVSSDVRNRKGAIFMKWRKNKMIKKESDIDESEPAIINSSGSHHTNDDVSPLLKRTVVNDADVSWVDRLGKWPARIIGISLAITSGLMYGFQFLPIEFLRNCDHNAFPCNELDYVFGQYVGIFVCSTTWFIFYCIVKRFKPQVYKEIIIPGIISGMMYGIGTAMWFLANKYVGLSVAFPIITSGSNIVSSTWGAVVFREITDRKSIVMFVIASLMIIAGIVLTSLSH